MDALLRADDHDFVTGFDDCRPLWNHDSVLAKDGGEGQRFEAVGFLDGLSSDWTVFGNLELRHLNAATGEAIDVMCRWETDDADDALCCQHRRSDHEVDAECALCTLPRLQIVRPLDSGDSKRV